MTSKMPKSQEKNLSKLLRISGVAILLVGTSILAGPAVAHAQDCPSPGPQGNNILLSPGRGSGGVKVGESAFKIMDERQNSGDYIAAQVCEVSANNPGKNVMIIQQKTYNGPDNLTGVTQDYDIEIAGNKFDVFVFDTGSFTNNGDLGYQSWAWSGVGWTRSEDQRTVTFNAP